jgi:hypothetical protein
LVADIPVKLVSVQAVHNVAVAGQRPLTLVLHSVGRFTALRDLSVALFRSYGADNFFASLPSSLTRLRASGVAGFKVTLLQRRAAMTARGCSMLSSEPRPVGVPTVHNGVTVANMRAYGDRGCYEEKHIRFQVDGRLDGSPPPPHW